MKKKNILKSFSDLPSATTQVADAASPKIPTSSPPAGDPAGETLRETLRLRATAPLTPVIPWQRWGLNE